MAYVINNRVFSTLSEAQQYITESDFAVTPTITEITNPEQIRSILDPTRFVIGPGFDDQDISKEPGELDPVATTVNDPIEFPPDEGDLRQRLYDLFNTGFRWADIAEIWGSGEESLEEILDRIAGNIDVPPEDSTQAREILGQYVTEAFDRAQEIVDTMVDNPEELADMEDPGELTKLFIEQGGMSFAGAAPPVTPAGSSGPLVITGGAGVTGEFERIKNTGGRIFGETVPVVQYDPETGEPLRDENGDLVTVEEYREGLLDVMVPYIPGVSLPNWMPTAGVIFLPTIQEAVNKVGDIIDETGIGEAWEEGDIGEVLNDIGEIIVRSGEAAAGVLEEKVSEIIGTITGAISDPTKAGTVLGGVIGTAFPSIPQWLPPLILDPRVYGAVRQILTQNFNTPEEDFPPITQEVETEQDPNTLFTNRGNNYFVNSETDEYFQLAESEDIDFEFNGQYTREQLEDTGLETINSGTYQSLVDDLSFHALEEDIYQYSMEDLIARYEEEGGLLPSDWKLMDKESQYNFFLDDYFDIPPLIEDPDKDPDEEPPVEPAPEPEPPVEPPPTDQPEPEPEPDPTDTSVIEGLFADFLAQLDEEFTGQQEQINQIIQNFVETLPDFDAMPTMEDIAEYFEINGVTLSQQNFDRIREELANAGYLTQEQLTEALAGVATPEQVQEAIQNAGFATPEQVMQALAEAGYATPEDITNALANSGFVTENRLLQALAEAGYATPDQVEQIVNNAISNIVIPEGATAEEVRQLIQEAIDGIPAGISLEDVSGVVNEAIANIEFPEGLSDSDVRNIVGSFGFATTEEVRGIINEAIAGIVIPEGATTEEVRQLIQEAIDGIPEGISLDEVGGLINEAISNIEFPEGLSGDDVRSIVDSFGFATTENVRDIVNTAISNIQFPEGATTEEVRQLIQEALDGLPEGISLEDIGGIVNEAIANIEFPEGLSEGDVRGIVDSFGFATSADVQAGFDDLNDKIDNVLNGVATQFTEQEAAFAADLLGLETSVFQQLAATEGALRDELLGLGEDLDSIRADFSGRFDEFADTFAAFQTDVSGQFDTLNNKIDDAVNGLSIQLTEQEATFLEELTGVEASVLQQLAATEGGLRSELESLGFNLTEFQSDVAGRFDQFEDTFALFQTDVGEQFADLNQRFDDAVNGIATQFSNQEAEFLASITGLEASFIQSLAAVEGGLSGELEMLGTDLISLQEDVAGRFDEFQETFTGFQANVTGQFGDLNDKLDDALNGIATQFSDQEAAFLETVTGVEASVLQQLATVEGGLSNQLQALGFNLASLRADVFGRFDEFEQTVGQQLTQAEQDRSRIEQSLQNALALQAQGQLRALTEAEARLLAEITGGNAEILQELSTQTGGLQQQLSDLGFNITDVESRLGEQITTGLSQAQQDRLRIEQGLYNALQLQSQGQAVELDEAEARLLAEITGGDAAILQEMSSQTGALENQLSSLGLNLTTVQQNLSQDISDLQAFTGFGFSEAAQQRQNLQQALIVANADITQLSSDMFAQFQSQNESIEELFEGTNVNIEALQQGQISQAEAFAQYAQSTDVRLGLGEQQREEILTRQADFERMYGEEQQKLQQQIMGGNVLTALAAGGMFAAPAVPTRAPYEEFIKGITYRPREAPQLAIKTPALDYNEEAQKLLMRTRRRGMLV